jgi:hypothetical protein
MKPVKRLILNLKTRKVLQQDLFGLATGGVRQKINSVVEVDGSVKRHKASRKALDVVLLVGASALICKKCSALFYFPTSRIHTKN